MAIYDERDQSQSFVQPGSLMNYAGAVASLALVVGVSVWGYQLIMRDVSGIPVVRAMEGEMRVAPQTPGGEIASHAGLSVNEVAGAGAAAAPSDSLLLAPATAGLAEEDLRVEPLAEADEVRPVARTAATETQIPTALETGTAPDNAPLTTDGVLALADRIAGTAAPLTDLAEGQAVAPTVTVDGTAVAGTQLVNPSVPGVAVSMRPAVRPANLARRAATPAPAPVATPTPVAAQPEAAPQPAPVAAPAAAPAQIVDTSTAVAAALAEATVATTGALPIGTNLVQLGAYPTAEDAATEWSRMSNQFADYMGDKERVIQEAASGGRTFYRLRASGFAKPADARRFCATLQAANSDCIPVVVR